MNCISVEKGHIVWFHLRNEQRTKVVAKVVDNFKNVEQLCVRLLDNKMTLVDYSRIVATDHVSDIFDILEAWR